MTFCAKASRWLPATQLYTSLPTTVRLIYQQKVQYEDLQGLVHTRYPSRGSSAFHTVMLVSLIMSAVKSAVSQFLNAAQPLI